MLSGIETTVGLFPGQGGYRRGALHAIWSSGDPVLRDLFAEVDAAARDILGKEVSPRLFARDPLGPEGLFTEDPEILQLAVFGTSLGVFRLLQARDASTSVLMGHSLGEITALVCAGAFSARAGAELICHRIAVTTRLGSSAGGMLSLACDEHRAGKLLDLVAEPRLGIAVVNGPGQVVLSGPLAGLRKVEQIADTIGVTAVRLLAPVAFHSREMEAVRVEVLRRIRDVRQRPLAVPVFSPILGRFYRDSDRLAELLSLHLVTPVRFGDAVRRMHGAGARIFVEMGAGSTLSGLAGAAFPEITALAPLSGRDEARGLAETAAFLREPGLTASAASAPREPRHPVDARPVTVRPEDTPSGVPAAPEPGPAVPPPASFEAGGPTTAGRSRTELLAEIRTLYAEALEYPEEVFTEDAHLEADLGVDSVKQTELLVRVRGHFGLPAEPDGARAAAYETVGAVLDWVEARVSGSAAHAR
ncbi:MULTISPECIES: acyltransferase domain-containing protein [Kitasatospora]|uniref:[acyl-carrier-protein] S-malonyltransferase n=1 Tax=Kitasatospora cystarginea TaxID=58350 RepID=A0ABP5RC55_9ACTN